MSFDLIDRMYTRRSVGAASLGAALTACTSLPSPQPPRYTLGQIRYWTFRDWGTLQAVAVGSRCTCDPPPTGTDQDWLAVAPANHRHAETLFVELQKAGWVECVGQHGDHDYPDAFSAWRLGEDNLIVASDSYFYDRFWCASQVARDRNLRTKEQRVQLFQAVLYGKYHATPHS